MFAWDTADDEQSGRKGVAAAAVVSLGFAVWAAAYALGLFPWLGYAWLKRDWESAGRIFPSMETRIGTGFGVSTFLFFEGQEIVIDYDAEIRAGALWFYVYRPFDGELGDGVAHYLTKSGAGSWTTKVAKTGIYTVTIQPTTLRSDDRGWDLSYGVWWGARPGG